MAIIRLQGDQEKKQGLYYEFDTKSHPLGEGGMGKVYRGRRINMHTSETRDVAIKFMFSGLPATTITRARNEANIRIQHENLVEMMGFLDVVVDGRFIQEERDVTLEWKGSANQRVIDVKKTRQLGQVVLHA